MTDERLLELADQFGRGDRDLGVRRLVTMNFAGPATGDRLSAGWRALLTCGWHIRDVAAREGRE